jgi:predicted nucleic acid-binding protein
MLPSHSLGAFPMRGPKKAAEIAERIASGETIIVPVFWPHEVLNALLVGEKRRRITPELTRAFIEDLNRLPIEVDLRITSADVFKETQALCRKHALTAYDAAYLEIALRSGYSLASADADLRRAALAEGVEVL